ncbi:DUF1772 domain-containing protein [Aurantivibrio plasticivorans]
MILLLILMTGLMAGIYFVFSVVIMKSLAALPANDGAKAMNKINDVILNTAFMPLFFISTLWFAGLIVWSFADWHVGRSSLEVSAAVIYIVGMFCVTAFGNVPLNNYLKQSEDNEQYLTRAWQEYLSKWTVLNHLRTISCIAACAVLVLAQL